MPINPQIMGGSGQGSQPMSGMPPNAKQMARMQRPMGGFGWYGAAHPNEIPPWMPQPQQQQGPAAPWMNGPVNPWLQGHQMQQPGATGPQTNLAMGGTVFRPFGGSIGEPIPPFNDPSPWEIPQYAGSNDTAKLLQGPSEDPANQVGFDDWSRSRPDVIPVGDVVPFLRRSIEPGMGTEGARTYMGGFNARVGSPAWNSQYEAANGLKPGTLTESNAGRGDVVNMPGNPAWNAQNNQILSEKQAGQAARNQTPGYNIEESDINLLRRAMNDPKLEHLFQGVFEKLNPEQKVKLLQRLYPDPPPPTKAKGGGIPLTPLPKMPPAKGLPPQSTMVERAGGIGMARRAGYGLLHSAVPGRTDKISLNVANGSYVIPADVVAGHGQGNSLAGAAALNNLFHSGPYGSTTSSVRAQRSSMPSLSFLHAPTMKMPKIRAQGGQAHIPVMAAGGEFIVSPEAVKRVGGGDVQRGFRILDAFVLKSRKKQVKEIKALKPPKKD